MSSYLGKFKYCSNDVQFSKRRIVKAIRRLHCQPQSSTQFNSTTPFLNSLPSTDIVKISEPNSETIVHLEGFSEIKLEDSKPKANFRNSLPSTDIVTSSEPNSKTIVHLGGFSEMKLEDSKPKVNSNENISNILYIEKTLFSNFFSAHSNIFHWNSSPKTLKKVVEIHKRKRFVCMEYVTGSNYENIPEQYYSKVCMDDVDFEYSKKNLISEYVYQTGARHSSCNSIRQDKIHTNGKYLVSPNSINNSCFLNSENGAESNHQLPSQSINSLTKFISNAKVAPTKMYQICLVLKDEPISYFLESASEEFKQDTEFVFDMDTSISYPVTDEKVEIYDELNVEDYRGINFNRKILQAEVPGSPEDASEMMTTIYDEIQNCKKILDSLEETTELIKKILFLPLLCLDADVTECVSTPELHLEVDFKQRDVFDSYVNKSFEEKGSIPLDSSLGIQYSEHKMNELAKSLGSQIYIFIDAKSYESLEHLDTIDEEKKEFAAQFRRFSSSRENSQDNSVDFHCKLSKLRNESEEELLMLPSVSTLSLIDSILFSLQITYENVEREVHSWLLYNGTDKSDSQIQNLENETSCQSVRTLANQHDCFSNNNYLMRFKGRNTDTTVEKNYEWVSSSSDSDALCPPKENEPESDLDDSESSLDDSESSLEGSFKQHRSGSRASTISSDDDFDDIPRFSLPSRISNNPKSYTKKTELFDEVTRKEWSWKNAKTEMSWKCTHKGRRFRSEEHCLQGGLGIPKDFLQEDLGIPEDLLRDFNRVTSLSENATNVALEAHVDKYSS